MKILIAQAIIFIAAITLTFSANAQSDYVITVKGDSIPCKISTPLFGGIKYQSATMSEPKKINPDEIEEYYITGQNVLHRAIFIDNNRKPVYSTVVEKGRISLFEMVYTTTNFNGAMATTTTTKTWYITKGTDHAKSLKSTGIFFGRSKRKDDFAEMLNDNKGVYDKYMAEDKFSFGQIRNLVHLYNTGLYDKALPFEPPQRDYVITKNKDTIFCEIEPATFNTVSRYRVNADSRFTKIDTAITEYFLAGNSSTYLLKTLPKNKHREFVKLLVKGMVNLYSYSLNNSDADSEAALYASKGGGELVQIKHTFSHPDKNEKKSFTDLISDDPNLIEKLKNLSFDFTSLVNYINIYNSDYLNNGKTTK
jgi:hypothetical protein